LEAFKQEKIMSTLATLRHKLILQFPAALVTLGLMWLFPFLVHLIPVSGPVPLGAQLLPIFYAPLLAAWLFNPIVGIASGLLMPFINNAFTGTPTLEVAVLTSIELSVFSLIFLVFNKSRGRLPLLAPLAVIIGKIVSALLLSIFPIVPLSPWGYFSSSVISAVPGLLILLALNLALVRLPHE